MNLSLATLFAHRALRARLFFGGVIHGRKWIFISQNSLSSGRDNRFSHWEMARPAQNVHRKKSSVLRPFPNLLRWQNKQTSILKSGKSGNWRIKSRNWLKICVRLRLSWSNVVRRKKKERQRSRRYENVSLMCSVSTSSYKSESNCFAIERKHSLHIWWLLCGLWIEFKCCSRAFERDREQARESSS